MWTVEHTAEAALEPGAVFDAWADVARWPEWNPDIERVELQGAFTVGSTITMTPRGQEPVELHIAEAVDGERFVDEAELDGTMLRTTHLVQRVDGQRVRVTYRLEATGPAAEQIGPAVSADFPETIAGLLAYAAG